PRTQPAAAGNQRADLPRSTGGGLSITTGKKTAEAIQFQVAQEVKRFLQVIFNGMHKSSYLDFSSAEMPIRAVLHQASAAAFTELLQYGPPAPDQRTIRSCERRRERSGARLNRLKDEFGT